MFKILYVVDMPRKCSVGNCTSNYHSSEQNVRVYQFPSDPALRERWLSTLPNIVSDVTQNMGICELHWPAESPMFKPPRSKYEVS